MKRTFAFVAAAWIAAAAVAEEYPSRPLRVIVPNPSGGTVDIVARAVAKEVAPRLGQPILVEPKPGADSLIGMDLVARAAPDGHTLMVAAATAIVINPLVRKMPFDAERAFVPVALLAGTPNAIVVHPSLPARSLAELFALAKARHLNYASGFQASGMHLTAERLMSMAGVSMNYIPYQGGIQAVLATVGGHAEVGVVPLSDAAPHIAAGRLRILAVTSPERLDALKDVPTVAESGFPGFEAMQRFGVFAPAGTPKPVIDRLAAEMLRAVDRPDVRAVFEKQCLIATPLASDDFAAMMKSETRIFAVLVKQVGLKAE